MFPPLDYGKNSILCVLFRGIVHTIHTIWTVTDSMDSINSIGQYG